ncbi:glutamate--tRNA ligase [Candidatus Babeliales bacterium]|nr:glutamate--tRNA ligase [Candidatus Babeliales bacterium]
MVRVRFAPSPTGYLHLGNVRVALLNYLFSRQKRGTFILRIEDTDRARNVDLGIIKIIEDLSWLGIAYDEGPKVGGDFGPYIQSDRTKIYQEKLQDLIEANKVYRCFCTEAELKKKRESQLKSNMPPKYDRTCLRLSGDMIKQNLVIEKRFIWRLKINDDAVVEINTMARGKMYFELKNFGDFALTRSDKSFTFLMTNFVDDWLMGITHVIRGEDHLSNTAMQGALFDALAVPLPIFWHLPMLCSEEGKPLSKRDFGFSLDDLKLAGFLPQAILNYLATIGGGFKEEVQSLDSLIQSYNFDNIHSTGSIKFDSDKLLWFNHKWIERLSSIELLEYAKPFLEEEFPETMDLDDSRLVFLLEKIKTDLKTLLDLKDVLSFYFLEPHIDPHELEEEFGFENYNKAKKIIFNNIENLNRIDFFLESIRKESKEESLKMKELLGSLRYMLTGEISGLSVRDILEMLEAEEVLHRLNKFR